MFRLKMSFNISYLLELRKKCFIFVQTGSSVVFSAACALLIPLFHTLFNKTVENLWCANRVALL